MRKHFNPPHAYNEDKTSTSSSSARRAPLRLLEEASVRGLQHFEDFVFAYCLAPKQTGVSGERIVPNLDDPNELRAISRSSELACPVIRFVESETTTTFMIKNPESSNSV